MEPVIRVVCAMWGEASAQCFAEIARASLQDRLRVEHVSTSSTMHRACLACFCALPDRCVIVQAQPYANLDARYSALVQSRVPCLHPPLGCMAIVRKRNLASAGACDACVACAERGKRLRCLVFHVSRPNAPTSSTLHCACHVRFYALPDRPAIVQAQPHADHLVARCLALEHSRVSRLHPPLGCL